MILLSDHLPQILLPNGVQTDFELLTLDTRIERVARRHGFSSPWAPAEEIAAGIEDYLRSDYQEETISLDRIAALTAKALFTLGFPDLASHFARQSTPDPVVIDLAELAGLSGELKELTFFNHLRHQLEEALRDGQIPSQGGGAARPHAPIHLRGMRRCVKSLLSAKRWSRRCEGLNAEIVQMVEAVLSEQGTNGTRVAMTAN